MLCLLYPNGLDLRSWLGRASSMLRAWGKHREQAVLCPNTTQRSASSTPLSEHSTEPHSTGWVRTANLFQLFRMALEFRRMPFICSMSKSNKKWLWAAPNGGIGLMLYSIEEYRGIKRAYWQCRGLFCDSWVTGRWTNSVRHSKARPCEKLKTLEFRLRCLARVVSHFAWGCAGLLLTVMQPRLCC